MLTDALYRCRLDIWVAKIGTNVDQVVDVFYVRDFDGNKINSPRTEMSIKQAIIRAVTPVDAVPSTATVVDS
jgi:[protein-PII] uridylyltransferase